MNAFSGPMPNAHPTHPRGSPWPHDAAPPWCPCAWPSSPSPSSRRSTASPPASAGFPSSCMPGATTFASSPLHRPPTASARSGWPPAPRCRCGSSRPDFRRPGYDRPWRTSPRRSSTSPRRSCSARVRSSGRTAPRPQPSPSTRPMCPVTSPSTRPAESAPEPRTPRGAGSGACTLTPTSRSPPPRRRSRSSGTTAYRGWSGGAGAWTTPSSPRGGEGTQGRASSGGRCPRPGRCSSAMSADSPRRRNSTVSQKPQPSPAPDS